jgi:hypothetical protein
MARYAGRVVVNKVDENGVAIKNLKSWIKNNPGKRYFDSKLEWEVWEYLKDSGISFKTQITLKLFDSVNTEEFQKPRQTAKARKEKRNKREIKSISQQEIHYTPDYYLPEFDVYIEIKGYADEVFKLRWKLFKLKGYKGYIVYSLEEFKLLYKELTRRKILSQNKI